MPKRKNKVFQDIMSGLDQALAWSKGEGKMHVTMPGKKARDMTRAEYEEEKKKDA